MLLPPSMHNNNGKIGFNTYVMWGLCFVVIGACYVYEEYEKKSAPAKLTLPADVQKALPSGAWLMSTSRASPSPPHARRARRARRMMCACVPLPSIVPCGLHAAHRDSAERPVCLCVACVQRTDQSGSPRPMHSSLKSHHNRCTADWGDSSSSMARDMHTYGHVLRMLA
jgi:hypothetical protein